MGLSGKRGRSFLLFNHRRLGLFRKTLSKVGMLLGFANLSQDKVSVDEERGTSFGDVHGAYCEIWDCGTLAVYLY